MNDYTGKKEKAVTVFGWSRTKPDTPQWEQAEAVGKSCAQHGFAVISGGYCGSMEAVSKGAAAVEPKVDVHGILVPGVFPDRALVGNQYLTQETNTKNMIERLDVLTSRSRYYCILPGTLGTLTELCIIWTHATLMWTGYPEPIIFAFRKPWEPIIAACGEHLGVQKEHLDKICFIDTPEEMMELIIKDYEENGDEKKEEQKK